MVPEGWTLSVVGDLFEVQLGKMLSPSAREKSPQYAYLTNTNVRWNGFDLRQLNRMHFSENEKKKFSLRKGDLIMCEGGEVGRCAIWDGALTNCYFQKALHRLRPIVSVNCNFFMQYMMHISGTKVLENATSRTSIAHLTREKLLQLPVRLPPENEQRGIANVLSTWDRAIETTENLIENCKARKKALLQILLMGKKRFSLFVVAKERIETKYGDLPLDWSFVPIGEIATEQTERAGDNSVLPVLSCSKYDGFVDSLQYFKKKVFSDDTSNYKVVRRGSYGFPSNHLEEGSIGYQDICEAGIVSPIYSVFKTSDQINDGYLFRLLKTEHYRQIFAARTNASVDRRGSLRWKEFSKIRVPLPPLAEQKRISETIDAADKELDNLRAQLARLQLEKRALMQQLLTGKRRVKIAA